MVSVRAAEAVELSEVGAPAGTAVAAGTAEAAEVEAVGTAEVDEAFGLQLLCAKAGGPVVCCQVFAEGSVVPAPFSVVVLL